MDKAWFSCGPRQRLFGFKNEISDAMKHLDDLCTVPQYEIITAKMRRRKKWG
jgi:hypothetical protein